MKNKFILIILTVFLFTGCSLDQNNKTLENTETSADIISDAIAENINDKTKEEKSYCKTEAASTLSEITEALPEIIYYNKDNMALYYYNLDTNEEYFFNEDTYFVTASLKKVPLAMQVLDKVQAGELSLDTEIEYQSSDYSDGTGILQFEEIIGKRTIKELVILSMIESDNIAFNMLNRTCGYTLLEYINDMLGENSMIVENDISKLTAKHNFQILYNLYNNKDKNHHYNLIIDSLKETAFNDSINKYLPKGSVSHKIGSYYRSYHDAAIVFGDSTYILVILTKDLGELTDSPEFTEDEEERYLVDWGKGAFELMAVISKTIYDIINN